MKKTSLAVLGLGALIATMSITAFAKEREVVIPQQNNGARTESSFKITNGGSSQNLQLDNVQYNTNRINENGRPPYVEGAGCCSYGSGRGFNN